MESDTGKGLAARACSELREGDIVIEIARLEGGSLELRARLSPQGAAIIEQTAASAGVSPEDLFGRVLRQALLIGAAKP